MHPCAAEVGLREKSQSLLSNLKPGPGQVVEGQRHQQDLMSPVPLIVMFCISQQLSRKQVANSNPTKRRTFIRGLFIRVGRLQSAPLLSPWPEGKRGRRCQKLRNKSEERVEDVSSTWKPSRKGTGVGMEVTNSLISVFFLLYQSPIAAVKIF